MHIVFFRWNMTSSSYFYFLTSFLSIFCSCYSFLLLMIGSWVLSVWCIDLLRLMLLVLVCCRVNYSFFNLVILLNIILFRWNITRFISSNFNLLPLFVGFISHSVWFITIIFLLWSRLNINFLWCWLNISLLWLMLSISSIGLRGGVSSNITILWILISSNIFRFCINICLFWNTLNISLCRLGISISLSIGLRNILLFINSGSIVLLDIWIVIIWCWVNNYFLLLIILIEIIIRCRLNLYLLDRVFSLSMESIKASLIWIFL